MSEVQEEVHALPDGAYINIDISDTNVKYDTNLTVPEVVFWLRVIESMAMNKVLADGE